MMEGVWLMPCMLIKRILSILIVLVVSSPALAYMPPIGIPAPTWGIDEVIPSRPGSWTESTAGYYLVDKGSTYNVCSDDTNGNGYPGHPRCTIPTLTKGSYVEIHGPYDGLIIKSSTDTTKPNGNDWSANANGPAWVTCYDVNQDSNNSESYITGEYTTGVWGSYIYLHDINVQPSVTGSSKQIGIGYNGNNGESADHIMIRNSYLVGDSSAGSVNHAIGVFTWTNKTINDVIIYNNTITSYGDRVNTVEDWDRHAVFIGPNDDTCEIYNIWVLENSITEISGHTIFTGRQTGGDPSKNHHVYIGKNTISDSTVSGIFVKVAQNVIISENIISNIADPERADDGKCFGMQYFPEQVWFINNTCSKAQYGAYIGANDSGKTPVTYWIGNVFYDLGPSYRNLEFHENPFPDTDRADAGIQIADGGNHYIVNNTFYNVSIGINAAATGVANIVAENNIISNINQAAGWVWWFLAPTTGSLTLNKNILNPGSTPTHKYRYDNTEYDTLANFATGSSTCAVEGKECTSEDPLLVNPASNIFRLNTGSPAIGSGIAAASLTVDVYALFTTNYGLDIKKDIAGTTRPQETTWDIGAYEYDPATVRPAVSIGAGAGVSIGSGATMTLY